MRNNATGEESATLPPSRDRSMEPHHGEPRAVLRRSELFTTDSRPQIVMGRDNKFFFPLFFDVKSLPAIYVYDKKGKFKQAFSGSVKIDKIVEAL